MQTQTAMRTDSFNTTLSNLPILKHFNQDEIVTRVDNFRNSEKNIFWFLKLAALGVVGGLIWVYVIPQVMTLIGTWVAYAAVAGLTLGTIFLMPQIFKALRVLARKMDRALIAYDPFGELAEQRKKMVMNESTFRIAKGKIKQLQQDMEAEAAKSEQDAVAGQSDVIRYQGKAAGFKAKMEAMVQKDGEAAKSEDAYVDNAAAFQKALADAQRIVNKLNQSKDFVQKYGSRANVMKKLSQKLVMVEAAMEIKISDFDATIEMLKKDYDFGQKSNAATTAAKSALGFTTEWQMDYALDIVASTISADIASTAGNLKDIATLTSNYDLNSDELFANLNAVADKIKTGADIIPSAKVYRNEDYNLTSTDKQKSGGFGNMF